MDVDEGPIQQDVMVKVNPLTGQIIETWGAGFFYMPHGLTIDSKDNIWITDVAMHQVFKIPQSDDEKTLVLGDTFMPGSDGEHFCQPTDVAVASNGDFFVSDGYCNSRVVKFSADGQQVDEWGDDEGFNIPHSLALAEDLDTLCVADRENDRIVCHSAGLTDNTVTTNSTILNHNRLGRIYAIEYNNGALYAVNGPSRTMEEQTTGFTVDMTNGEVVSTWRPQEGFGTPHDVTTSPDGRSVYVGDIGKDTVWEFEY